MFVSFILLGCLEANTSMSSLMSSEMSECTFISAKPVNFSSPIVLLVFILRLHNAETLRSASHVVNGRTPNRYNK